MCVCGRERTVPSVRIVRKLTRVSNDIVQPFPEVTNILAAFVLPLHAPLERRRITRPRSHRDPFRGAQGSQKTLTRLCGCDSCTPLKRSQKPVASPLVQVYTGHCLLECSRAIYKSYHVRTHVSLKDVLSVVKTTPKIYIETTS